MADGKFLVGFSSSIYQTSGDPNPTNWGRWETLKHCCGGSTIFKNEECGVSCDFWELYRDDIGRASALGATCFRISLEWSRIEPTRGAIDGNAVTRYHEILDELLSKGMEPIVTLHHFVHPLWFEQLGGFRKESNITLFVEYCQTAFRLFGSKVRFWVTFNEPNVAAFTGDVYGSFPSGQVMRFAPAGRHLLNQLRAHTQAYAAIKAMPGGDKAEVGLVHNWFWFEPKASSCCIPFYTSWLCNKLTSLWGNEATMRYLQTGIFDWKPFSLLPRVKYCEPRGRPGCDFIGLNYYSRAVVDWKFTSTANPGEVMTDMPYPIYPEGMLTAIDGVSCLGIPIYITETGIADRGDERRPVLIQTYFEQVEKAVQAGYDIRGLLYWSLVDNFEWNQGFSMKFGVFDWSPDSSQRRKPREKSCALLSNWFHELPGRVACYRQQRQQEPPQHRAAAAAAAEAEVHSADK